MCHESANQWSEVVHLWPVLLLLLLLLPLLSDLHQACKKGKSPVI